MCEDSGKSQISLIVHSRSLINFTLLAETVLIRAFSDVENLFLFFSDIESLFFIFYLAALKAAESENKKRLFNIREGSD